jgi:hypothetical protein
VGSGVGSAGRAVGKTVCVEVGLVVSSGVAAKVVTSAGVVVGWGVSSGVSSGVGDTVEVGATAAVGAGDGAADPQPASIKTANPITATRRPVTRD